MDSVTNGWWSTLYDDRLADVLLDAADPRETEATADFLVRALELSPGARVFDQCCGTGRLSIALARRGHDVLGVDLIERYVARASAAAASDDVRARFVAADAFAFAPDEPCAGAFNWWTSFGYADDDATNVRMLARAHDALRPGAAFALDFHNVARLLRGFREHVVTRRTTSEGEIVLVRESAIDLPCGRLDKRWIYFLPDGRRIAHDSAVRLYLPSDLGRLLGEAGFADVRFFGDLHGGDLSLDSPRCIALARRRA
jgi:SAM-dependent methyltransferase